MKNLLLILAAFALHAHADLVRQAGETQAASQQPAANIPAFPPEAGKLLEQAAAALHNREADKALPLLNRGIALYEKTFADFPYRHYAAQSQTETLYYLTRSAAEQHKETVYVIDGNWAAFYYLRAYAHIEKGGLDAAEADLDTLLKLSPANALAYNERGHLHSVRKNWDAAQADFKAAQEFNFTDNEQERQSIDARAQRGLAFILIERGRLDEAEAIYLKLLEENPQDRVARNQMEYIRQQRGKR